MARRRHPPHLRARGQPQVAERGKRRRLRHGARVRFAGGVRALVPGELGQLAALLDELDPDHDKACRNHHTKNDDDDLEIGDHGPYRI